MKLRLFSGVGAIVAGLLWGLPAHADVYEVPVSLRGSAASMVRQNSVARTAGLEFVQTHSEEILLEALGEFVRLEGNADYGFRAGETSALARPELRMFIERVAGEYRTTCGEKLIVTSTTRPVSEQPSNAHELSVHPTGIAVDLRVSASASCRAWLETTLLGMETRGLLDVTREHHPPHYHVALFPEHYVAYERALRDAVMLAEAADARTAPRHDIFADAPAAARSSFAPAAPASGDSPWTILAALPFAAVAVLILRRRS